MLTLLTNIPLKKRGNLYILQVLKRGKLAKNHNRKVFSNENIIKTSEQFIFANIKINF